MRLCFLVLHHHTVSFSYLFSSLRTWSPSCDSLVQFLCSRVLRSSLKLYSVFRFTLHFLFPKSSSAGPKLLAWMITHSFPPPVSTTCFYCFAFPFQQFMLPQISATVLSLPFSSIQHLVLFLPWPSITPVLFLELVSPERLSEYIFPSSLIYFSSIFYFGACDILLILSLFCWHEATHISDTKDLDLFPTSWVLCSLRPYLLGNNKSGAAP